MALALKYRTIPDSPVARWDARWKLAAVLIAAGGVAVLTRPAPAAVALAVALGLLAAARLPRRWVRLRLGGLALATLPFVAVLPFTLDGPGWELWRLHFSWRGLEVGAAVALRCLAIGAFALVLVGTTPMHHTLAAAHRLWLPGLLVQIAALAYRYSFLLADELKRLRTALRVRGFRAKTDRHSYRTLGHVTGALLVRGADRADHVAAAMRCRGFDGRFHTITGFRSTAADIISFAAAVAAVAGLLAWDR
jgi:cobalt/nickel transport system permease protein